MEKLVIYGKGGIGKSTIASNLSVIFAQSGKRVLHVGCDPKHDSTIRILDGKKIETVMDKVYANSENISDLITKGIHDIDCIECGGPPPGVGCGGRGVSRMFEILEDEQILEKGNYDIALFDVLGDVVCGGFAAPLRKGFANKVFIVISEEIMSMYAANKIVQVIEQYEHNKIVLGGLIVNKRDNNFPNDKIKVFAEKINTDILAIIPRSDLIIKAEEKRKTVESLFPNSPEAKLFKNLALKMLEIKKEDVKIPKNISDQEFDEIFY